MNRLLLILMLILMLRAEIVSAQSDMERGCRGGGSSSRFLVSSNADDGVGSLRWALSQGYCGEVFVYFESDMTIQLDSPLTMSNDLSDINSGGHQIILNSNGDTLFQVNKMERLYLIGLTLSTTGENLNNALIVNSGELTLQDMTVTNNSNSSGGVIVSDGVMEVISSTFATNNAMTGVIDNNGGFLSMDNVTFYGNGRGSATNNAAIYNSGVIEVNNITITEQGGVAAVINEGNLKLENSILYGMDVGTSACQHNNGVLNTDHNIIEGGDCAADVSGDPLLQTLADNGGLTMTVALDHASSAINQGSSTCANTDQRGVRRPQYGVCDLGAYEADTAGVLYVDNNSQKAINKGACDEGTCWQYPFNNLQSALSHPGIHDIWIAAGVYHPDEGLTDNDPYATFSMITEKNIFGGFAGNETALEQRNPDVNVTILSGDIDNNDSDADMDGIINNVDDINGSNSYNVVTILNDDVMIDGVTITAGDARLPTKTASIRGDGLPQETGGGIQANSRPIILNQVNLIGNRSERFGGGLANCEGCQIFDARVINNASSIGGGAGMQCRYCTVNNSLFQGNSTSGQGAAFDGSGQVLDSVFINNQGDTGGAVMFHSYSEVNRSWFINNSSNGNGGAARAHGGSVFRNSAFINNISTNKGGALWLTGGDAAVFYGVTMVGNQADIGGAVYASYHNAYLFNSIIWSNQDASAANNPTHSIAKEGESNFVSIARSDIEYSGGSSNWNPLMGNDLGNNVDADPGFITAFDFMNPGQEDLRLRADSALIDQGYNGYLEDVLDDFDVLGNPRVLGNQVDMGAFESDDLIYKNGFESN